MAENQRKALRESFEKVEYFCATSDVWSRSNISFIAVSVHYFQPNSFELQTKFIACEHFAGRHTNDKVTHKLASIFDRYDIKNKVHFVTTDGGSEYVAAFKYSGDNYRSFQLSNANDVDFVRPGGAIADVSYGDNDDNDTSASGSPSGLIQNCNENILESESGADDDDDDDPDVVMRSISDDDNHDDAQSSSNDKNSNSETFHIHELPDQLLTNINRIDCSSHKLDKLGKIDVKQALGHDQQYDSLHKRTFTKLDAIWKLKDSRISAEIFHRITGKKLTIPHRIRWLKTNEAVSSLISHFSN